ncbi:hypothetical protein [Acinetobacter sp. Marseille-Q1618]|uniref:hypothetical protein n=1 Tax=Acinetobacter sp. Marseille-Q1618 TaxID=2697502 RepID=UPI00156F255E|nr:hypothetical protein [Acinetobacter sp. Marseille-Q1618]
MPEQNISEIKQRMSKNPIFVNNLDKCPADTSPDKKAKSPQNYSTVAAYCRENTLACYKKCEDNQGDACYFTALNLQQAKQTQTSEQLFQRGCELGVASACTNRAAGAMTFVDSLTLERKQCITRTFEKSCNWNDPWGCTMYAAELINNDDSKQTYDKALDALIMSCVYGKSDPACVRGMEIKQYILNQRN